MSLIGDIYAFFDKCPLMEINGERTKMYVNYLSKKPAAYAVYIAPTSQKVRKYVDGEAVRQTVFVLKFVEKYEGRDVSANIETVEFLERLVEWIDGADASAEGWLGVETLTGGWLCDVDDSGTAVWQVQCRVLH